MCLKLREFCRCHGYFFFFKQKTAYEMRISDWSSDVCSSDLLARAAVHKRPRFIHNGRKAARNLGPARIGHHAIGAELVAAFLHGEKGRSTLAATFRKRIELRDRRHVGIRLEKRRVGKECVSRCRSRWSKIN